MIKFRRLFKSFRYAIKGFVKIFKEEQNLQIQSLAGVIALFLSWYYQITKNELIIVILLIGLVVLMEIINSAIERVTDILKPRINVFVMEIKDIMAAAVMLASLISIIIGLIIFVPYILK